ncbi:MAG: ABC transporter permease, partial [Janthinobacterium sp.]
MNKELIQKFAALGSLSLLLLVFSLTSNAFFSVSNGMSVALQVTSIAYLGIAATCVIITGGIDLSSGSVLALAGVAAALLVKSGVPVPVAMLGGILVGAMCGAVNGFCITQLKLPPFIAT